MKPKGYKTFSADRFNKHSPIEDSVIEKLRGPLGEAGFVPKKNPDKHDIDIQIWDGDTVIGAIEVEHAVRWDRIWPCAWQTVHFLGRKKKYVAEGAFYLQVEKTKTDALMVGFDELQHHGTILVDGELCDKEPMWDVPKENCIWGWRDIIDTLLMYLCMRVAP